MDRRHSPQKFPACRTGLNRRKFLGTASAATFAATLPPLLPSRPALAAPSGSSEAETGVKQLHASLSDAQRKVVVLPLDDPRRQKISANWKITTATIGDFFRSDQQELITGIFRSVTSEDGFDRFSRQMNDDSGGLQEYSVAIFGDPGRGPFEFELTGRHHTIRADGDTIDRVAFGGPVVYGHGVRGNSSANLFSYQTKRANEVFSALDGKQRQRALLNDAPRESAVQLRGEGQPLPGIAVGRLSADQKELVEAVLRDILLPYRREDVDEVLEIIKASGGVDKIKMAFYKSGDLDKDGAWDVWRLEGPTLVCHFRGAPHVHAYINVSRRG
jgi:hypothetical protein